MSLWISIHPLRGEWDGFAVSQVDGTATISIHPLRGEWDVVVVGRAKAWVISIHPLRGEWDNADYVSDPYLLNFNPPTPWGVGLTQSSAAQHQSNFNPPTPWGVGRQRSGCCGCLRRFQSTHSVGSGTDLWGTAFEPFFISIHPLRGEWDPRHPGTISKVGAFQSTHSVGSGTGHGEILLQVHHISIHPLRGEWDPQLCYNVVVQNISIHPLRGEWDPKCVKLGRNLGAFQSTHSVGSGTYHRGLL